ncbi:hypothetical protein V5739_00380 [Salinimicrobium sp. TIG7-5_MAKvit]|uniref:hypothetical protein n=1 Tax=Salinimicrobium sp. TIG7-5_MAKvit TaxID=3121289 RepID=UPI003C6E082B
MKNILLILFYLHTSIILGQEVYFSPMTEYLQTGQKEIINRTISIGEGTIIIKTETDSGYDIQSLKILEKKVKPETIPPIIIYDCTSPDGFYPTLLFVPQRKEVSEILVIQPSLVTGLDEHFRFYIENKENLIH